MLYDITNAECDTAYQPSPRFVEWEPDTTIVTVPKLTLKQAGWKAIKYPVVRLSVKSYVDTQTGEIIKKRDMYKSRFPVPHNSSMKLIGQLCVVNSLNKKAKELCIFILRMRNNRGSFVLPLEQIIEGYINRHVKVARVTRARSQHYDLMGDISAAGIIANEQALGSLFQRHGMNTPKSVLEESAIWYAWPGIFSGKAIWSL